MQPDKKNLLRLFSWGKVSVNSTSIPMFGFVIIYGFKEIEAYN